MSTCDSPLPRRRGVSVLGILAVVFGGAGGLLSLTPCLGFVAGAPLAALGFLLGISGLLVSGISGRSSVVLPIVGTVVSVLALVISAAWLGFFGVAVHRAQAAEQHARLERPVAALDADAPPVVKAVADRTEWTASFTSGGKPITVEYFAPRAGDKLPVLLLVHGADGLKLELSRAYYRHLARELARRGFLVGFVHYFERTDTEFANPLSMAVHYGSWRDTVQDALTAAAQQPRADGAKLGLVGISLGGTLVLDVGGRNTKKVGAVVDVFGGAPDFFVNQIQTMPPTLILHGAKDTIVPLSDSRKLAKALRAKDLPHELHVYPSAGHGFIGADLADSLERAAAFLRQHLD